LSFKKS